MQTPPDPLNGSGDVVYARGRVVRDAMDSANSPYGAVGLKL